MEFQQLHRQKFPEKIGYSCQFALFQRKLTKGKSHYKSWQLTYLLNEKYIESELDENFNISEVIKTKETKISGVSGYLGVSGNSKDFLKTMYRKGILTEEGKRIRFLYSPPLNLKTSDSTYLFYSSNYKPELFPGDQNNGVWTVSNTQLNFYLDSTTTRSIYGRIILPLDEILGN